MLVPLGAAFLLVALWALRDIVVLVAFSVLLAYALDPVVSAIERPRLPGGQHVSRPFAAGLVILVLVVLVTWLAVLAAPRLGSELASLLRRLPAGLETLTAAIRRVAAENQFSSFVDPALDALRSNVSGLVQNLGSVAASWTGKLFGGLAQLLGLAVLPVLSFYLLAEREAVQASVLRFVPEEAHEQFERVVGLIDRALKSYVRGQATVCLTVGGLVAIALGLIKFPLALALGVTAGLAEVVPYLGAIVATLTIAMTGLSAGPGTALVGVIVYIVINNAVGLLVTPRVMGQHLTMHPFVVTVSILAGASLLGPAGAMLSLPGAAVAQALVEAYASRGARPQR